ncbi:hypothetical protein [Pedobacter sp. UYP30]
MDRKRLVSGSAAMGALYSVNIPLSALSMPKESLRVKIPPF